MKDKLKKIIGIFNKNKDREKISPSDLEILKKIAPNGPINSPKGSLVRGPFKPIDS